MAKLPPRIEKGQTIAHDILAAKQTEKPQKQEKQEKKKKRDGVYRRDKGDFAFIVSINDADGKKRWKEGSGFKTRKEAEIAAEKAKETIRKRTEKKITPEFQDLTMGEVFDYYLKNRSQDKKESTIARQKSVWKCHLSVRFENVKISEITKEDLESYMQTLYTKGDIWSNYSRYNKQLQPLSYASIIQILRLFYCIYGTAADIQAVDPLFYQKTFYSKIKNEKIQMPQKQGDDVEEHTVEIYTKEQTQEILDLARKTGSSALEIIEVALYAGLRKSEILGLEWNCLDFEHHTIRVKQQLLKERATGTWYLSMTKTKANRTVFAPSLLFEDLAKLKQAQEENKHKRTYQTTEIIEDRRNINNKDEKGNYPIIQGGDFVFRNPQNGELITSISNFRNLALKRLGINVHLHAFRHTHASVLACSGVSKQALMQQMGHQREQTLACYYLQTTNEAQEKLKNELQKLTSYDSMK